MTKSTGRRRHGSFRHRVLAKTIMGPDCWTWDGFHNAKGYGQYSFRNDAGSMTCTMAHRAVYEVLVGPIPEGLHLDHLCRNKGCVNPSHLEPATNAENVARVPKEAFASGARNHNGRKTHCPQGHPYAGANLRMRDGRRRCAACDAASWIKTRERASA